MWRWKLASAFATWILEEIEQIRLIFNWDDIVRAHPAQ
jgi:hypothetical protein